MSDIVEISKDKSASVGIIRHHDEFVLPLAIDEMHFSFFKILTPKDLGLIRLWLKEKNSRNTVLAYGKILDRFFAKFPAIHLSEIGPEHISAFQMDLEATRPSTLNQARSCFSSLFQYGIKFGLLQKNPSLLVKFHRVQERVQEKILEIDQVKDMILRETDPRNHLMLQISFALGLRVSELIQIKFEDFHVSRKKGIKKVVLSVLGKGEKLRFLNIPILLWEKIEFFLNQNKRGKAGFIFKNQKTFKNAISRIQAYRIFRKAGERVGLLILPSPHWARHFAASQSLENGMNIRDLQKSLGHASINTTEKYLRLNPEKSTADFIDL